MKPPMSGTASHLDIELASETLAVVLSECCRHKLDENERSKGDNGNSHRGGKNLFRHFVKENSTSVWKPELVKSVSLVKFGGFLHEPPTLLLQADPGKLQHIRDAWSNRVLRPPVGYHIDFVGDVTRIGAKPLSRGRFIPLCDAICVTIRNVTSRDDLATQEAILVELERTFPAVHSPSRELLHETLGKLIRERKVFCTGPGYHLVTKKTYSGKSPNNMEKEEGQKGEIKLEDKQCAACARNRSSFASQVSHRRSFHTKNHRGRREREVRSARSSPTETVESEGLHGSVVPDAIKPDVRVQGSENLASPQKSPGRGGDVRKSSLAEKVANKIFRRRHKSSSERKLSGAGASPKHRPSDIHVRELSPSEAQKLGYTVDSAEDFSTRPSPQKHRKNSKSPSKVTRSESLQCGHHNRNHSPENVRASKSFRHDHNHARTVTCLDQRTDITPHLAWRKDNERTIASDRMWAQKEHAKSNDPVRHQSPNLADLEDPRACYTASNRFPTVRDAAVSCNLDVSNPRKDRSSLRRVNSVFAPSRKTEDSVRPCETRESFHVSPKKTQTREKPLRRSKSLRLPRDRHADRNDYSPDKNYTATPREQREAIDPPDYESLRFAESHRGLSYDSLRYHTTHKQGSRKSVSSTSTGRDYSYLHACHFAPSIRVGSVIVDHLEELDRRRRLRRPSRNREMSPASSLSSTFSDRVNPNANDTVACENVCDVRQVIHSEEDDVIVSEKKEDSIEEAEAEDRQSENDASGDGNLDLETAAALKIAKRLAKLGIKMTRQEWKEYFSSKVLPDHVERSLLDAKKQEIDDTGSESPTSCFENTSGSVETVIDLSADRRRSRHIKEISSNESTPSPRRKSKLQTSTRLDSRRVSRSSGDTELDSLKGTTNFDHPTELASKSELRGKYYSPESCTEEENDATVLYTYENGHRHFVLCSKHKQLASLDNASLTEDSGFHSARERSSLSSWDTRYKKSATFV